MQISLLIRHLKPALLLAISAYYFGLEMQPCLSGQLNTHTRLGLQKMLYFMDSLGCSPKKNDNSS